MADKKPWLGVETAPQLWIYICITFNWIGILALVQLIICEIVLITNDFNNYTKQYGHGYRELHFLAPSLSFRLHIL